MVNVVFGFRKKNDEAMKNDETMKGCLGERGVSKE